MRIEDSPPGARYLRLYNNPRMVLALLVQQRDQDSIAINFRNRIKSFNGSALPYQVGVR